MLPHRNGKRFYCWKSHAYEGVDLVGWNYWKIPLIDTGDRFRKMTHREIANLKGFPASYNLPDHKNRSWLYQKLMYAVNVQVTRQIADRLIRSLSDAPIRERQISQEEQFENLFARYLAELADKSDIKWSAPNHNLGCDFMLQAKGQVLYFELKCYRGRYARLPGIEKICDRFSRLSGNGKPVLVFANEVNAGGSIRFPYGMFKICCGCSVNMDTSKMSLSRYWIIQSVTLNHSLRTRMYFRKCWSTPQSQF